MAHRRVSRRQFLIGTATTGAALAWGTREAPAQKKAASLRLWILKTYVEPTNKAVEASAQRWAAKHGGSVTVEYFTFEDMQTKYVAAIENKNTPDVGQLETSAPARFAGMGQLLDLSGFAKQVESQVGKPPANVAPVTIVDGKTWAIPWYIMAPFWYVWRDEFEKKKVKLPTTFEEAKQAAHALNRPRDNFYGLGQSWNRTADGYGVMQSLMYSYGAGWATRDGKYRSLKTPAMQKVMRWATDIYKEGIQPADTLTWTGSGNNENFIAHNIAQTSNGPSITFAMENAVAKATDAADRKKKEEALAIPLALPHPAGPETRRMWAIAMSFSIFKNSKDPEAAMSLVAHLLSPEETLGVMKDSYGQFAPVLDKGRLASADHGGGGRGAGEQRPHRRARQGHRRQVVGGPGHRVGGQEDQGDLLDARRVRLPRALGRDTGAAFLFLLPLLVLVIGLIGYPFARAIWLSLTDKLVGYPERFVGLRNYEYLWHDDTFREVVRNTLVFTAGSLVLKVLTGLAMALVLKGVWRGRNFFRGLFLLPWITSTVIIALTWRWMFDAFPGRGFFNSVLLDAGVLSRPIAFMATPEGAMMAVIVANWWRGFPFFGVSFLAGMQSIPRELYEAASVDGAATWRRFWHITLPGLKHVIIVTTLLSFILTINDFNIIYVMTRGGPGTATQVFATYSYQVAFNQLRWGRGVTVSIFLVPVLIVAIALVSRYLLRERE